jgi:hypothetical protein
MQMPTIGRSVHYVLANGEHRPATVVRVGGSTETVNLQVLTDGQGDRAALLQVGLMNVDDAKVPNVVLVESVPYADAGAGAATGTWHWPERELTAHERAVAASAGEVGFSQR